MGTNIPATKSSGSSGAVSWRSQMFAFAVSKYSTIGRDVLTDFSLGVNGDYAAVLVGAGSAVNYPSTFAGGGIEMDTGASTLASNSVSVARKGNPTTTASMLTGAPWFVACRVNMTLAAAASASHDLITLTQHAPFGARAPSLGIRGSTSTANYTLNDGTSFINTGVAITIGSFVDLALGFDGVTLSGFVGQVASGTMSACGTSTNLAGILAVPGQPGTAIFTSDTTRVVVDVASLYGASPNP